MRNKAMRNGHSQLCPHDGRQNDWIDTQYLPELRKTNHFPVNHHLNSQGYPKVNLHINTIFAKCVFLEANK